MFQQIYDFVMFPLQLITESTAIVCVKSLNKTSDTHTQTHTAKKGQ